MPKFREPLFHLSLCLPIDETEGAQSQLDTPHTAAYVKGDTAATREDTIVKDRTHSRIARYLATILTVVLFALASCGGPQTPEEPQSNEPAPLPQTPREVSLEAAETMEAPTAEEAVAVFVSGEVVAVVAGDVRPLEIGDTLSQGAVIQVEADGYAEIQLADRALLRLDANTQLTLERLVLSENEIRATARVGEGSVLSRVERLTGRDNFNLRSDAVVAGVRGTRFKLTVAPDGESTVAVEEGRVSLLPPEVDIAVLEQQYGEESEILAELAPVVEGSQQITLGSESLREVGERLTESLQGASGEDVRRAFESAGASLAEQVPPADQINPESQRQLRELSQQRFVPLRTETAPDLLPLRLTAEPESAVIVVETPEGRQLRGRGTFAGLFEEGDEIAITLRAEGFETRSFRVTMEEGRGYTATVTLPELPESEQSEQSAEGEQEAPETVDTEPAEEEQAAQRVSVEERDFDFAPPEDLNLPEPVFLTVLTRPGRAEIRSGGSVIGRGSAFVETEVGERLTFSAELDGFAPATRSVEITAEMDPVVEITLEPRVTTEQIVVVTEPSSAEILLDGERVGRGRVARTFETGRQLSFTARAQGYFEASRTITVRQGSGGTYRLRLEEEPRVKEITLVTEPASTRITVNGEFAGRGRHTARYEWGSELTLELSAPGYIARSERITVREEGPSRFEFSLDEEPQFATLTVEPIPGDARVLINGAEARRGERIREFEIGRTVTVVASRAGFERLERQVEIEEDLRLELRLEPTPIEGVVSYAGGALVRGFAVAGEDLLFADSAGRIYRYTLEGDEMWSFESGNAPNENSIPVIAGGRVYFTGAAEALAVDLENGELLFRTSLDEDGSHLFGRTVTPLDDGRVLFPDNRGVRILSGSDGSTTERIEISGGARSSVAVDGRGVLVDQNGLFHLLDLEEASVVDSIPTGLVQPVAARPAILGSRAVAVDRRGNAAAVDLASGELLWERQVSGEGLFSDPLTAAGTVYFTSGETLYALDPETGENVFAPIPDVDTPPVASRGSIFVGSGEELLELDPRSGTLTRRLSLGVGVSGRPVAIGERLVVGTAEGSFVVVNRTGWAAVAAFRETGE